MRAKQAHDGLLTPSHTFSRLPQVMTKQAYNDLVGQKKMWCGILTKDSNRQ